MRCTIVSRAGQVLAYGRLFISHQEDGLRLNLETDRGRVLEGGLIGEDGDMTIASEILSEQFFDVWGMSDLTLSIQCGNQSRDAIGALPTASDMDMSLL
ncbi:hypothetical protein PN498_25580 [Oscillatoria sp. CS-180]|uniref:hypothetical protein n=1 Tax=Oscillatoria sp. CS-180 TaxID=3021720 RepID=UPI00232D8FBB|nr:hypothetical protein [Oscillatoria sp. CS-180]MDB9529388.1 hypothetical protein [Oscillatoria sp. CS-180]